jgi:hypothetical protein
MKKVTTIIATAIFSVAVSYGQTLIGGFDFNQSFSDLALDGPASDPFVSFSFQDPAGNPFLATQPSANDVSAGLTINSGNRFAGVNDEFGAGGSLLAQSIVVTTSTGGFFDFSVNAGGNPFTDIEFRFGASITQAGAGGSTVGISYSLDGGSNFISLGTELIDTLQASGGQQVSTSVLSDVTNDITFRVGFNNIDTGVNFDNLQVSGTVVPEPSTYAAIFGAIALGFVAYRRRK